MSDELTVAIRTVLDRLEAEETKLLAWGVVDGGFSLEEVEDHARAALVAGGSEVSVPELQQAILDQKLLFAFRMDGRELFRTRMAEAVRLFARLRQMFPNRRWQLAPTLVADFRFDRRPRRYPRRYLTPAQVVERLVNEVRLSPVRRQALEAMLRAGTASPLELADFQLAATRRILLDLEARGSRGVIVCAGTGTGKTLAFYLPALAHVGGLIQGNTYWTKALAIYPRNELLKDQFSETYLEARRLDPVLTAHAGRKLIIGAFFGSTPRVSKDLLKNEMWDAPQAAGYVCPFLRCPGCGGDLAWRTADVEAGTERLSCTSASCGAQVTAEKVMLTRERMARTPPDVLFTTTEMLNRQMSNGQYGHIFGLGPGVRRPQIMLLDEVHTYEGVSGAQVAILLRRWQHAIASNVQFTGLSATLQNAAEFFEQLTGLKPGSVEEVSPRWAELDPNPEAVEHVLALRGDPASGTSLLSTSIQAAMLLRRILDPRDSSPSEGLYGKRVFVFTDDLDVTNRLYNNLQNAEGQNSWGRPRPGAAPLAALRSMLAADNAERLTAGQSWQVCEEIGHAIGLTQPLQIGRTSSQDTGVDRGSDVIVATAALEVGYNDPDVGAVMQHKAPRDWAAYLQRKGRAGRRRTMRPWTVVVLSDYGRDRVAYQAYDQFFDPELPYRSLPTANRYVLRMQAAFAFMDWMAQQIPADLRRGSVWTDFSGPPTGTGAWADTIQRRQEVERRIISELLAGSVTLCRSLEGYLGAALAVSREQLQAILWDPPRPLYTALLPTLYRRLESGWRRVPAQQGESDRDYLARDHPIPDFVPKQLFGDLNLPEVEVVIPRQGRDPTRHFMPIVQALRTFAPGRVSRRFGTEHAYANHWIALPNFRDTRQRLAVEDLCAELEDVGEYQVRVGDSVREVRCVRPWAIHPTQVPGNVLPTSNSQLVWRSQIVPADKHGSVRFEPPRGSVWDGIIHDILFYTHNQRSHVEARRFAIGTRASVRFQNGTALEAAVSFMSRAGEKAAAVGFSQEVDGIAFRYRFPRDLCLQTDHPNQAKVRAFRTAYFRQRVHSDTIIGLFANTFQRDWLVQIYLSALTVRAVTDQVTLQAAHAALQGENLVGELERVLEVIFQTLDADESDEENRQRVHASLLQLCHTADVVTALGQAARVLWEAPDDAWHRWARDRFTATLGGALMEACQQSCPQMDVSDLVLDLDPGPRPAGVEPPPEGLHEIWITEATMGGGGVVEEVLRIYAGDPRRFFRLAESALDGTDFEVVDRELTRLVEYAATRPDLQDALLAVRTADGNQALQAAVANLRRLLASLGFVVNHVVMTALHARVLRPGSSAVTDGLLRKLIRRWHAEEERLGVEIDARVFAYLASEDTAYEQDLAAVGPVPHGDPAWRFQAIYGLLWPRGFQVRAQALSHYNPYAEPPPPDRQILLDVLQTVETRVRLEPGWLEKVRHALTERGTVYLDAPPEDRTKLKQALLDLAAEPVEAGFLHLYPHLAAVSQDPDRISLTLDLREVLP
jgi:hypothetical protein